jgi:hypothetical protein
MLLALFRELAPFALLSAGIAVCAWLFLTLKKEIFRLSKQLEQSTAAIEDLKKRTQEIDARLDPIRIRLEDAEERTGVLVAPEPPKSGLNLHKRSQVLKMARIGEPPQNIAAALNLPRKEVELIIKVQKIVLNGALEQATS